MLSTLSHLEAALYSHLRLAVPVVGRIEAQLGGDGVGAVALRELLQEGGELRQALRLLLLVQNLLPAAHQALQFKQKKRKETSGVADSGSRSGSARFRNFLRTYQYPDP